MIDLEHFARLVLVPTLKSLEMDALWARSLLLTIGIVESEFEALEQYGGGPALGFFQMEPRTHDDNWASWLAFRPHRVNALLNATGVQRPDSIQMVRNLPYAVAMARIWLWRRRFVVPRYDDSAALARIWKNEYNTERGAGRKEKFIRKFQKHGIVDIIKD